MLAFHASDSGSNPDISTNLFVLSYLFLNVYLCWITKDHSMYLVIVRGRDNPREVLELVNGIEAVHYSDTEGWLILDVTLIDEATHAKKPCKLSYHLGNGEIWYDNGDEVKINNVTGIFTTVQA